MTLLSDSVSKKFVESINVSEWEILTDTGWENISHTNKTIEYEIYEISTSVGRRLECADNHILFDENMQEIFAKDTLGKHIQTKDGPELVTSVRRTGIFENMYDLTINSKNHRYYTDGFLSHNTTVVAAFFCWYIIFHDHKTCAILANKAATAREILSRIQFAYELLPSWVQHGVAEWNKGSFLLENNSRIIASSTTSSAARGYVINFLFLDEFAFVQNTIADEFFTSVYPTISSGASSKIAIVSTPNGMNHFYKKVMEAKAGTNGFKLIRAIWSDIPTRDEAWRVKMLSALGEVKFSQEMECEFLGGSNTLISGTKLKSIVVERPLATTSTTRFYDHPEPGHSYVISVDTGRGTGNDYSAFVVIDVSSLPYKPVAIYADNTVSPMIFPGLIHSMAQKYNKAAVLVETNDMGEAVAMALHYDLEYEETIMSTDGVISSFGGRTPGLKTTKRTKSMGCSALKVLVETDQLLVRDYDILYELSNFTVKGPSYAAENGNDDLVMCMVLFAYLTTQEAMENLTSDSAKARILQLKQQKAEDEMIPIGFFSDGTEVVEEILHF